MFTRSSPFCSLQAGPNAESDFPSGDGNNGEGETSDAEEEGGAVGSLNPGDFAHREDEKAFNVSPSEGIMLLMQSTIGNPGRDSAAVATQASLSASGLSSVWILSDQRSPGLQAVLQPGPDGGKLLKVAVNGRPAALPGLAVDAEALLSAAGVNQVKGSAKYNGEDFCTSLSLTPFGQGPPNAELNYHQGVCPGWTAGGTMAFAFADLFPLPVVQRVVWGTFGSWTEPRKRDKAVYVRFGAQPRQDGSETLNLALQSWHKVGKGLEMGANLSLSTLSGGGPAWLPVPLPASFPPEASAGVGGRMTFEGPGGLNPILLAHLSTSGVASLQWQKPTASPVTNTFMRTTLSAVLDHPKRDYKWGVQLELYY